MATYKLPYFGKVTLSEDDDYHEIEDVDINGGYKVLRFRLYVAWSYRWNSSSNGRWREKNHTLYDWNVSY